MFYFFGEVIDELIKVGKLRIIAHQRGDDLEQPLYEMKFMGKLLAVSHPGVGVSLATEIFLS